MTVISPTEKIAAYITCQDNPKSIIKKNKKGILKIICTKKSLPSKKILSLLAEVPTLERTRFSKLPREINGLIARFIEKLPINPEKELEKYAQILRLFGKNLSSSLIQEKWVDYIEREEISLCNIKDFELVSHLKWVDLRFLSYPIQKDLLRKTMEARTLILPSSLFPHLTKLDSVEKLTLEYGRYDPKLGDKLHSSLPNLKTLCLVNYSGLNEDRLYAISRKIPTLERILAWNNEDTQTFEMELKV